MTDGVLVILGLRFLLARRKLDTDPIEPMRTGPWLLALVATSVGLASGLLANSGGFLLAPLYAAVLRMPIKAAFASSLAVAAVLAVPGRTEPARLERLYGAAISLLGIVFLIVQ